jgi:DNA (cytosine-5)-methyltransferase 1
MRKKTTDNIEINKKTLNSGKKSELVRCVDLFCGAGGLTHGLIKGGIQVAAGIDLDSQCRFPYESNNDSVFIQQDISQISGDELINLFGNAKIKVLAGCAPCQPFSSYSQQNRRTRNDTKWGLVSEFGRLIEEIEPDLVTMENVPQILTHQVFKDFLSKLKQYHTWYQVVDCRKYGIPQTRKRLVLLASRFGEIELLSPNLVENHYVTVRKAISKLPSLAAGQSDERDPLHTASSLSKINLRRIQSSKPGGTWRDWDESLLAQCHRKDSGQTYSSVYGRMEWDAPAPTITTQCFGFGNGRFGHPEQDRAISLREAAILQTFPKSYKFMASGERARFNVLGRLIGNAVPVCIGEIVGRSLVQHLCKHRIRSSCSEGATQILK